MKKLTILIIPDGVNATRQFRLPRAVFPAVLAGGIVASGLLGYLASDYVQLRALRSSYRTVTTENEGLKGEARILMRNLDEVKNSLRRVQDYTTKLGELTALRVQKVSKKTGIGPLTPEEYSTAQRAEAPAAQEVVATPSYVPLGVNMDHLIFRPVFDRLAAVGRDANQHALELQHLLSNLSQQRSLLDSVPSFAPVDGWISSNFGSRISPFTGKRTMHEGLDIAAPAGTPIVAPADGVVVFSGSKEGYGNFIMIAHGYGVVTRYGHIQESLVQPGQKVHRGEQIATVGETGRATGPHLHYEVVVDGHNENPKKFILGAGDLPHSL